MLRDEWSFEFTAKKIAEAALRKRNYHLGRLAFWKQAKTKTMEEVRETGIEVSESVGDAVGSYSSKRSGFGPQVMVRTDLQQKLTECHGKIIEHRDKISEYAGWVQVLNGNPEARLQLHASDYLYFFEDVDKTVARELEVSLA